MKPLRWVRSTTDYYVAGVAGGLAKELNMEPWVVRLLWILGALCTFGLFLVLYVCFVIALPRDDRMDTARNKKILGVCARIDARGDMEVGLARLLALMLLIGTGGAAVVGYIVLHFVLDRPIAT